MATMHQNRAGGSQPKTSGKGPGQNKTTGRALETTIQSLQKLDLGDSAPATTQGNSSNSTSNNNNNKKGSGAKSKKKKTPEAKAGHQKKATSGPVLLGLPDTPMAVEDDVDPYVTKIGGVPNWLDPSMPAPSKYGICQSCGKNMFLLLQAYVPLEKSPYDRVIYLWACNQRKCMRNKGSFRIVRGMKLNPEYASKLEKKKPAVSTAAVANPFGTPAAVDLGNALFGGGPTTFNPFAQPAALGSNPFGHPSGFGNNSSNNNGATSPFGVVPSSANPFGAPSNSVGAFPIPSGTQSFASAAAANVPKTAKESRSAEEEDLHDEDTCEDDQESTEWPEQPAAFKPHYLYITEEVLNDSEGDDELVAKYSQYMAMGQGLDEDEEEEGGGQQGGGASWGGEVYEKDQLPRGMDKAFQKFTERVQASGAAADQCVRYDFGNGHGTGAGPLLYSYSDETAKMLLPANASQHSKHTLPSAHRIAKCPGCRGPRAFELQLMPNTLAILEVSSREHLSEEERASLGRRQGVEQFNVGMEWGTLLVYSCAADCFSKVGKTRGQRDADNNNDDEEEEDAQDKDQVRYYEEVVLVQLEEY